MCFISRRPLTYRVIIVEREARRIIVLPDSGPCGYIYSYNYIYMSSTDVGWAPPGGVKDNKEENDALAWKGVAIATQAFCGARDVCRAS